MNIDRETRRKLIRELVARIQKINHQMSSIELRANCSSALPGWLPARTADQYLAELAAEKEGAKTTLAQLRAS